MGTRRRGTTVRGSIVIVGVAAVFALLLHRPGVLSNETKASHRELPTVPLGDSIPGEFVSSPPIEIDLEPSVQIIEFVTDCPCLTVSPAELVAGRAVTATLRTPDAAPGRQEYGFHLRCTDDIWIHGSVEIVVLVKPTLSLAFEEVHVGGGQSHWTQEFEIVLPTHADLSTVRASCSVPDARFELSEPVAIDGGYRIEGSATGVVRTRPFDDQALSCISQMVSTRCVATIGPSDWHGERSFSIRRLEQLRASPPKLSFITGQATEATIHLPRDAAPVRSVEVDTDGLVAVSSGSDEDVLVVRPIAGAVGSARVTITTETAIAIVPVTVAPAKL